MQFLPKDMAQVLSVTEARKQFLKLVDEVDQNYTRVDLTKNGRTKAVLISADYLNFLEETIYTLQNSMEDISEAEKQVKEGKFVELEDFVEDINGK